MNIIGFLNRFLRQEKPAQMPRPRPATKAPSTHDAAEQALKEFFSKNQHGHGR